MSEVHNLPAALLTAVEALERDEALCEVFDRMPWREVFKTGLMNGWHAHQRHTEEIARLAAKYASGENAGEGGDR